MEHCFQCQLTGQDWVVQQVSRDPLVVCMQKDDPLARDAQVSLSDLAERLKVFRDPAVHPSAHKRADGNADASRNCPGGFLFSLNSGRYSIDGDRRVWSGAHRPENSYRPSSHDQANRRHSLGCGYSLCSPQQCGPSGPTACDPIRASRCERACPAKSLPSRIRSVPFNWSFLRNAAILFAKVDGFAYENPRTLADLPVQISLLVRDSASIVRQHYFPLALLQKEDIRSLCRSSRVWRAIMSDTRMELPQGTLDLLILKAVALEPLHGWAISERLQQISSDALQVQQGSLVSSFAQA